MSQNESIKLAQAELIQQVAEQNGINVNAMDDAELAKFASYVLSQFESAAPSEEEQKLAEAEAMGRHMARAFADEQNKLASASFGNVVQMKVAEAMEEIAEAKKKEHEEGETAEEEKEEEAKKEAAFLKLAAEAEAAKPGLGTKVLDSLRSAGKSVAGHAKSLSGYNDIRGGMAGRAEARGQLADLAAGKSVHAPGIGPVTEEGAKGYLSASNKLLGKGVGKAALGAAALGGLGYGAYRLAGGGNKEASALDVLRKFPGVSDMSAASKGLRAARDTEALLGEAWGRGTSAAGGVMDLEQALPHMGASAMNQAERGAARRLMAKGVGKAVGTGAGAVGLGYGAYRAAGGGEKKAALEFINAVDPVTFAKLAEARAAEIMAANGINPETLEACEPSAIKIASVPTPDEVSDWQEKIATTQFNEDLNSAAMHILDKLGLLG